MKSWVVGIAGAMVLVAAVAAQSTSDPRSTLKAGLRDAGEAIKNLEKLASLTNPAGFFDPKNPGGTPTPPERDPKLLPIEFRLLGTKPGRWTPEVVISRHQGLLGNVEEELTYGMAVAAVGPAVVKRLAYFHPGDPDVALDTAINGKLLSRSILAPYQSDQPGYAVEATLTIDGANECDALAGVIARAASEDDALTAGYAGGVCADEWNILAIRDLSDVPDELASGEIEPITGQHTYRLEIDGERIRFFIDNIFAGEAEDDRWTDPGSAGLLLDGNVRVTVTGFRVFSLAAP